MRQGFRAACSGLILSVSLLGCTDGDGGVGPDTDGGGEVRVTVDTRGDEQQKRARDIARRYAPDGTFTLELHTETTASTDGASSSRSSTVVVFTVEGGERKQVVDRLLKEPHVLAVD